MRSNSTPRNSYVFIKMSVILWAVGIDQLFMYYTRGSRGS
jgi:hypothetical protein